MIEEEKTKVEENNKKLIEEAQKERLKRQKLEKEMQLMNEKYEKKEQSMNESVKIAQKQILEEEMKKSNKREPSRERPNLEQSIINEIPKPVVVINED